VEIENIAVQISEKLLKFLRIVERLGQDSASSGGQLIAAQSVESHVERRRHFVPLEFVDCLGQRAGAGTARKLSQ
jgi:hypothetical protein